MQSLADVAPSRTARIVSFLTKRMGLSVEELLTVRDAIDEHVRKRVAPAPQSGKRTLYLPKDSLDDL
jgi:hypothetical protein